MTRRVLVAMASVALASCGGGGGGSSLPIISAPAPTPTPTPTSTPTPSPTSASYPTYGQLTGDQSFKTACAALRYDYSPALPVTATAFGRGLTLGYTAASQTYLVSPDGSDTGLFGSQPRSYGPADRDTTATTGLSYARTGNGFQERLTIGSNAAGGASPDHVRGLFLRVPLYGSTAPNASAAQYQCVFGVPTRLDDLPAASMTYTRGGLNGVATSYPSTGAPESYAVTQSQVSVAVDFATGRLTTTVHLIGALQTATGTATTTTDLGTYTAAATIDRSAGSYGGQITSVDRVVQTASLAGWFFGPQAGEAAFSLAFDSLDQASGRRIIFLGNALALK